MRWPVRAQMAIQIERQTDFSRNELAIHEVTHDGRNHAIHEAGRQLFRPFPDCLRCTADAFAR
jgi:hypothetical protein